MSLTVIRDLTPFEDAAHLQLVCGGTRRRRPCTQVLLLEPGRETADMATILNAAQAVGWGAGLRDNTLRKGAVIDDGSGEHARSRDGALRTIVLLCPGCKRRLDAKLSR